MLTPTEPRGCNRAHANSQSVIVVIPSVALGGWRPAEGRRRAPPAAAAVHRRRRRKGGRIVPAKTSRRTASTPRRGRAPHLVTAIASGAHASRGGGEATTPSAGRLRLPPAGCADCCDYPARLRGRRQRREQTGGCRRTFSPVPSKTSQRTRRAQCTLRDSPLCTAADRNDGARYSPRRRRQQIDRPSARRRTAPPAAGSAGA